jgi:hypothetical protein
MLPTAIDDLKSAINRRGGLASANRFSIYIQQPLLNLSLDNLATGILSGGGIGTVLNDPRDMSLLCESCSIPGRQITTSEYVTVDHGVKKPYTYINEDVTFTFHLTEDFYIRKVFDSWMGRVIDTDTHRLNYKETYVQDVIIQQLAKNGVPIYSVKLREAFPISVNAIELNNSAENTTQKVTVTMAYKDFEPLDLAESVVGSANIIKNGLTSLPGAPSIPDIPNVTVPKLPF